jgi:hypothetical protein
VGVLPGGQDPLGGQAEGLHGGPVLHRISRQDHQGGAGAQLLAPGAPPQAVSQRLGGGDDQGLELAAAVRPGGHDTGPVMCKRQPYRCLGRWGLVALASLDLVAATIRRPP